MTNRKAMIAIFALLVAAVSMTVVVFAGTRNCCQAQEQAHQKQGRPAQAAEQKDAQTATIEITNKGFEPDSLKLKAGVPAKVTFVRKTDETCAKEVVIKEYDINRKLPLGESVAIEFTPRKGEFTFACGMNMLKGKLIVE